MAWLYKRPDSGRWWIGYRHHGAQILRSTGQQDKEKAEIELAKVEAMIAAERAGTLTFEVFQAITGKTMPRVTLDAALTDWTNEAAGATAERTRYMYQKMAEALRKHFRATAHGPLASDVTREQLQSFLTERRARVAASSANLERRIMGVFFRRCKATGAIRDNPVEGVKPFKTPKEEVRIRRPFKAAELVSIYKAAPDDFWRYMVLAGFYTGLRLGDLVTMPIGAVDFQTHTINILTRKTRTTMHIPIAAPLYRMLQQLKARRTGAKETDPFWPKQAHRYETQGSGWLAQLFHDLLLVPAGISLARPKGGHQRRTDKRRRSEVSFHCFRHSYVSTLAALGQNQQTVKALVGHSSDAINDIYTKVPGEVLTQAVALLPDITKREEA